MSIKEETLKKCQEIATTNQLLGEALNVAKGKIDHLSSLGVKISGVPPFSGQKGEVTRAVNHHIKEMLFTDFNLSMSKIKVKIEE